MTASEWADKLKEQIKFDRDYIPSFETTVQILSELLYERDRVYQEYQDGGANPVIVFTTDRGAQNLKPNPLLKEWQDLNSTALLYLRDLGLTPAGLRKLQGQLPKGLAKRDGASVLDELRGVADRKQQPLTIEEQIMREIRQGKTKANRN